jgi:PAS domain S-box-containing protein
MTAALAITDDLGHILGNQAAEMLFLIDPASLRVILANPAASVQLGYGPEQLAGMRIEELECGLVGSIFWRDVEQSVRDEGEHRDTEFHRCDGSWLPVERRVCRVEHDGRRYLIVSARDVGDRRALERRLDDVTGQLNSILECTTDGILALDLAGRVLVMNRAFADMWQVSWISQHGDHLALLGRLVKSAKDGPAVAAFLDCESFARETAQSLVVELGGGVLRLNSTPLKIGGAIAGRVISCSDITERTRYEAQLARHNEMLEATVAARTAELSAAEAGTRLILDSTADGLIGLDREATITFANGAACELLGCLPEQLLGRNVHDAIHRSHGEGAPAAAEACELVRAIREGRALRDEGEVFRCSDGGALPVSIAVHPMARGNHAVGAVMSFSDTSLRRETERARDAALAEATRLARIKSEFLANMSHEIRTPLNGVIGIARIGYRKSEGRAEAREYFSKIIDSGSLLLGIINDILDFSKIDAGKLQLEPRIADPVDCLERCISLVRPQADAGKVDLVFKLGPDIPRTCMIDSLRLEQIVINLLSNAIKFTEQGSVTLALRRHADRMVVSVADTGIGMDADQLARIFEPFEQADGSTTRRFGGTGLGLSITRRLVELMQGRISVDSARGAGSHFEVELPLVEAAGPSPARYPTPAETAAGAGNRLAGLRILVAEDNEINQFVIREMLCGEGCEVELAADGQQAVALAAGPGRGTFDLVLMDVQMPVLNGYEATQRIRAIAPQLPIVALTAHALAEERRKCLAAGMEDIVSKPIDPEQLVSVIRRHALSAGPASIIEAGDATAGQPGHIDYDSLQAHWNRTPGMAVRLLRIFLESREDSPQDLRDAVAAGDMERIGFVCHNLKSVLGSIEATHGAMIAADAYRAATAGESAALDLAMHLADELDALRDQAAALLAR